jgi:hypothetical protein
MRQLGMPFQHRRSQRYARYLGQLYSWGKGKAEQARDVNREPVRVMLMRDLD